MKSKFTPLLLILLVILISILMMTLPSFNSKEFSRIELRQDLNLDLVLDSKQDVELIFFGYAGCVDVCTPRLEALGKWYATLSPRLTGRAGLKFLDLSVPEDRSLPDHFAKAFHNKFTGIFLEQSLLGVYARAFSVYFSQSLLDENEMDHTTHLYLIKRDKEEKQLRFIYTAYPYDFTQIQADIEELIHE